MAGSPQASFTLSSSEMLFCSTARQLAWASEPHSVGVILRRGRASIPSPIAARPAACRQRESGRIIIEAAIDASAAVESALGVGAIIIVNHARYYDAFVFVQRMLEQSESESAVVEHQVFADIAVRIRRALAGNALDFDISSSRGRFGAIGADHHGFGALENLRLPSASK